MPGMHSVVAQRLRKPADKDRQEIPNPFGPGTPLSGAVFFPRPYP
jgi:hypothetical protein